MSKKLIIGIVGETATGKNSVVENLPYNQKISYTTRPMRIGEVNGREHWFITDEEMDKIEREQKNKLLAWTNNNGYRYCAVSSEEDDDIMTYIINPHGIRWFKQNGSKNVDLLTIGITASLKDREERAKNRSDFNTEFYNRVQKEQQDFNLFKMNNEFDYLIYNHDLDMTINIVSYIISEEIHKWINKEE